MYLLSLIWFFVQVNRCLECFDFCHDLDFDFDLNLNLDLVHLLWHRFLAKTCSLKSCL